MLGIQEMTLDTIYTPKWFSTRFIFSWRAPVMGGILRNLYHPKTYIDAGCAIGDLVEEMTLAGVDSLGIEGSQSVIPYTSKGLFKNISDRVLILDLRKPITLPKCDLCTCFEVAEHIEEWGVDTFLDNLCGFSDTIVMSICTNQGGRNHVTLKPRPWWDAKMTERGYLLIQNDIDTIKRGLEQHKHREEMRWWYERLVVYKRYDG